ncbi:MAG: hypothetical protein R2769_16865 [Saprospiraceae bacterium]
MLINFAFSSLMGISYISSRITDGGAFQLVFVVFTVYDLRGPPKNEKRTSNT